MLARVCDPHEHSHHLFIYLFIFLASLKALVTTSSFSRVLISTTYSYPKFRPLSST